MTKDEALKLALNGYSKEDIVALGYSFDGTSDNDHGDNKPEETVKDETKPEDKGNDGKYDEAMKTIESLTKTVTDLTNTVKAIQDSNVANARVKGSKDNNTQSASEVIKDFIKQM